ncbi:MAG: hypothetical protein LBB23_02430 [Rickettsiales bacterium]|nr:hypothetical protein [Rickettsiales bacterium]
MKGNFIRRDPGVKPRDDLLDHYPACFAGTPSPAKGTIERDTPPPWRGIYFAEIARSSRAMTY